MTQVRWRSLWGVAVLLLLVQACATRPAGVGEAGALTRQPSPAAGDSSGDFAAFPPVQQPGAVAGGAAKWQHHPFPGKQPTQYSYARVDGRHAVVAKAAASASMLRQSLRVEPAALRDIVFSWKVDQLIAGADLSRRDAHDAPVRLVLAFEGDRAEFSMKNAMLSELSLALTGEALPYATLMYVWCNACAAGSVVINPRTDRIREIVLESGPAHLGRWQGYQRDIRADYQKAFGTAPGALLGVGFMTDTDNTRQNTVAWYGPVSLTN